MRKETIDVKSIGTKSYICVCCCWWWWCAFVYLLWHHRVCFFLNVIIVMKIHVHVVGFVFVSLISFLTLERICGCLFWMWCKLSAVLRWSSCFRVMDSSPFCGSNCFYFIYCIPVTSQTAITSPNMSYRVQLQYYWNTCCNNKHHDRRTVRWLQNFWYSTTIPFCPAELTCVCVF